MSLMSPTIPTISNFFASLSNCTCLPIGFSLGKTFRVRVSLQRTTGAALVELSAVEKVRPLNERPEP